MLGSAMSVDCELSRISEPKWPNQNFPSVGMSSTVNAALGAFVGPGSLRYRARCVDGTGAWSPFAETVVTVLAPVNAVPVVSAGNDITIQLPVNSTKLLGVASDVEDPLAALTISWLKIAGPNNPAFDNFNTLQPNISNLIEGVYTFRLTVEDTNGALDSDEVKVTVLAALPNAVPVVSAGNDITIQLPVNSTKLLGVASDVEDPLAALTISWLKIAGPNNPAFDNFNTLQPNISNLIEGVYTFRLTVEDTNGALDSDEVKVTVLAAVPIPGCPANPNLAGCQLPAANNGDPVIGACAPGFQGAGCNFRCQNGNWAPNGANNCVPIPAPVPCPAMANNNGCQLPAANNGAVNVGQCAVGFQGGGCNFNCVNGVWNEMLPNNCQPIPAGCPAVPNQNGCQLPAAPDGANAGACAPGFAGGCGFACNNGVWQQQFPNNCVAVPVVPPAPDPDVVDGQSNLIPCGLKQDPLTKKVLDPCEFKHVIELAKNIINFLIFRIASPLAAIMFAYAGFLYITNNGNEGKVKQAHDIFLYVFWGFVVALGAWLTVSMILSFFVDDKFNFLK